MSVTSILIAASVAIAPEVPFQSQLSSGRSDLRSECRTFDRAVEEIETGAVPDGIRCLQQVAAKGQPLALRALGLMRLRGQYLARDEGEAVALFHQAARLGDAESMYLLGQSYQRGIGVAEDGKLARFWLDRAAAQGYVASQVAAR